MNMSELFSSHIEEGQAESVIEDLLSNAHKEFNLQQSSFPSSEYHRLFLTVCRRIKEALRAEIAIISEYLVNTNREVIHGIYESQEIQEQRKANSPYSMRWLTEQDAFFLLDSDELAQTDIFDKIIRDKFHISEMHKLLVFPLLDDSHAATIYVGWRNVDPNTVNFLNNAIAFRFLKDLILETISSYYFRESLVSSNKQLHVWRETSTRVLPLLSSSRITRQQILELVAQVYGYHFASLWMVDKYSGELHVDSQVGFPNHIYDLKLRIGKEGIVGLAATGLEPVIVPNVSKHPTYIESSALVQSELAIPLVFNGEVFAVLDLQTDQVGSFDETTVYFMRSLANQLSIAIKNAEIYSDMQEQEERIKSILQNLPEALVAIDPSGQIIYTNPPFKKLYGLPSEEDMHGRKLSDLIGKDDALLRLIDEIWKSDEESRTATFEKERHIIKTYIKIPRLSSRVIGTVILLQDITKEAEVDKMKSELVANVSHDLKTPLTSLVGYAGTARRDLKRRIVPAVDVSDPKVQKTLTNILEDLEKMIKEGHRLQRLIDKLLNIRRIESGDYEWNWAEIPLSRMIHDTVRIMSSEARKKGLSLEIEVVEELNVYGDEDQLMRVISNLISNAIKYTDAGKVVVKAKAISSTTPGYSDLAEGTYALLEVIDTGSGIAKEDIPQLFERFRRVGDYGATGPAGTGLGLYICKKIVEQHQGRIEAKSQLGLGSVFSCAIPTFKPFIESTLLNEPASGITTKEISSGTRKILVVDDEESMRRLIERALEQVLTSYNAIVYQADGGGKAIEILRHNKPDLVILDIQMQPISGLDVLSIMKQDKNLAEIPILMLTIRDESRHKATELGATYFLEKPIDIPKLEQVVSTLLKSSGLNPISQTQGMP